MWNSFHQRFSCQIRKILIHLSRPATNLANVEIEMKRLNDTKQFSLVLTLFDQVQRRELPRDQAIVQALKACTQLKDLQRGVNIHKKLSNRSINNHFIQSALIHFYMQCGDVSNARRVFDASREKTMPLCGAMMKGFIVNHLAEEAIQLFSTLNNPNDIILVLVLNSCAQVGTAQALQTGHRVVAQLSETSRRNKYVLTSALNMFIRCGDADSAENWFSKMKCDVIDYGQMMKCFNVEKLPRKTLNLFEKMKREGVRADLVIYLLLIDACSQLGIESICQSIVEQIPPEILNNVQILTALIDAWGKAGNVLRAKELFQKVNSPDIVTFTAMIHSYGLNGLGQDAVRLFRRIPPEMISAKTYVCVLNACSHSGLVDEAREIFYKIPIKSKWDYTAMVDCVSRSFAFDEAQILIEKFEEDHPPCLPMHSELFIYQEKINNNHRKMSLLSAVRNAKNGQLAKERSDIIRQRFPWAKDEFASVSVLLGNTLAASGDFQEASDVRWALAQSGLKKTAGLSWTEVNGEIAEFRAHDRSHPRREEIDAECDRLLAELIEHGHIFDSSWITRPLTGSETVESILNGHSERLALAFNFIQRPVPERIQITKNLRICGDCHAAIKLISLFRRRDIIIRDTNRVHHFSNGQCSCHDYF